MRITKEMIAPELRLPGKIMSLFSRPNLTEEQIRNKKESGILRFMSKIKPRGLKIEQRSTRRPDGSSMNLYVVSRESSTSRKRTGILSIHGGGYSGGRAQQDLIQNSVLLKSVDAVFVMPEYRRSVEAPYPAALDDCYLALTWLRDHADELGVRSDQLAVLGGSAGGGLTAATSLLARDRGEIKIAFQVPLEPMIDDRPTPSSTDNNAPIYDGVTNQSNWRIYLGDLYGTDNVPATAAPARATDYSGLPPTITMVGGIEPFRDETVAYVENLRAAGVPVAFREFPGAWHGFEGIAAWTSIAKEANAWRDARLREYVEKYTAAQ